MSRWRCKACKGEYEELAPDGTRYFHVCPPLVDRTTGETKPRPKARDERPQDLTVAHDTRGVTIVAADGRVLAKNPDTVTIPIVAEGAGREAV